MALSTVGHLLVSHPEPIFIPVGRVRVKIFLEEIVFIESLANYVKVHTAKQTYITNSTMSAIVNKLPANWFCRINRFVIVNIKNILQFDKERLRLDSGHEFSFGELGKKALLERIHLF